MHSQSHHPQRHPSQVLEDYVTGSVEAKAEEIPLIMPPPGGGRAVPFSVPTETPRSASEPTKKRFWDKEKPKPREEKVVQEEKKKQPVSSRKFSLPDLGKVHQGYVLCLSGMLSVFIYLLPLHFGIQAPITPLGVTVFAIAAWIGFRYFKKQAAAQLALVVLAGYVLAFFLLKR